MKASNRTVRITRAKSGIVLDYRRTISKAEWRRLSETGFFDLKEDLMHAVADWMVRNAEGSE
jgi:hypothetical protein